MTGDELLDLFLSSQPQPWLATHTGQGLVEHTGGGFSARGPLGVVEIYLDDSSGEEGRCWEICIRTLEGGSRESFHCGYVSNKDGGVELDGTDLIDGLVLFDTSWRLGWDDDPLSLNRRSA